jgi:hypothetical protein
MWWGAMAAQAGEHYSPCQSFFDDRMNRTTNRATIALLQLRIIRKAFA